MRVAIIGSRNLQDQEEYWYNKICESIPKNCTEIVSGGAEGIDTLARRYATEYELIFKEFLPEYNKYGKSAPLMRNMQIIEYANIALVFWDGESRGTAQVIKICCEIDKPLEIFFV